MWYCIWLSVSKALWLCLCQVRPIFTFHCLAFSLSERSNGQSPSRRFLFCSSGGRTPGSSERFDIDTMKKKGKATQAKFHCLSRQLHLCPANTFNRAVERSKSGEFFLASYKIKSEPRRLVCLLLSDRYLLYNLNFLSWMIYDIPFFVIYCWSMRYVNSRICRKNLITRNKSISLLKTRWF